MLVFDESGTGVSNVKSFVVPLNLSKTYASCGPLSPQACFITDVSGQVELNATNRPSAEIDGHDDCPTELGDAVGDVGVEPSAITDASTAVCVADDHSNTPHVGILPGPESRFRTTGAEYETYVPPSETSGIMSPGGTVT